MAVTRLAAAAAPVVLAILVAPQAQASKLVDQITLQAQQHKAGLREKELTLHAGRPAFQIRPTNGYPGTEVKLSIASHYEIFERGQRREIEVLRAVIDWGDGSKPIATPGGLVARHTYGTRSSNGAISPTKGRDYIGRVTLHLAGGDVVTEKFRYVLWTDRATLRTGGRILPHEEEDRVWCTSGNLEGGYCVEHFDVRQIVHSFEGCFDHNFVEFPIANAPAATFDARSTSFLYGGRYSEGWHVDSLTNEIAAQYGGRYWVRSNRGETTKDNMSGIYYHFNPIPLDSLSPGFGESRTHVVIDTASVAITRADRSYTNKPFISSIAQQPSQNNGWIVRLNINDDGAGGGTPPCPKGRLDGGGGWLRMDVEARIAGRLFSQPASSNDKLPSGYYDLKEYQVD